MLNGKARNRDRAKGLSGERQVRLSRKEKGERGRCGRGGGLKSKGEMLVLNEGVGAKKVITS